MMGQTPERAGERGGRAWRLAALLAVVFLPIAFPPAAGAQTVPARQPGSLTPAPAPTAALPKWTPVVPPGDTTPPPAGRAALLPLPAPARPLSSPALPVPAGAAPAVTAAKAPAPSPSAPVPPAAVPPVEAPPPPAPPPVTESATAGAGATAVGTAREGRRTVWATDGIYIRAEPRAGALVLDTLEAGDQAETLSAPTRDGWVRIGRGGKALGWVAGAYLSARSPDGPAAAGSGSSAVGKGMTCLGASPVPARVMPPGTRMRVTTDTRIRREPSCESLAIDVLDGGAVVTVLGGGNDGWYRVRGAGWDDIYVAAKLLAPLKGH